MLASAFIILFLIFMTYWWGHQGFFSAFIHCVLTFIAAALAVALWEPLVLGLLIHRMPQYAWGVGLLAPFILILMLLRVIERLLVKTNLDFSILVNYLGGGACGCVAGLMSAGMGLLGLGFLPFPPEIAGYFPMSVATNGTVEPNADNGLVIQVDRRAENWLEGLSGGVFHSSTPLFFYQPELTTQAALFRLRYDSNASVVTLPGSVEVTGAVWSVIATSELPESTLKRLGKEATPDRQLLVVDTEWTLAAGTFDEDRLLRLPPTQVRLVVERLEEGRPVAVLLAPVAAAQYDPGKRARELIPFDSDKVSVIGSFQEEQLGFVFVLPPGDKPRFILLRHTRFEVPEPRQVPPTELREALGRFGLPVVAVTDGPPSTVGEIGDREGLRAGAVGSDIELTNLLPMPISRNMATAFEYDRANIVSGTADVSRPSGPLSNAMAVRGIAVNSRQAMVRVKLAQDQAKSLLGATRVAAASLQIPYLTDSLGQQWFPIGYVHLQAGGKQLIYVGEMLQSGRQIPVREMGPSDEMYLYYAINKAPGLKITSFNMSNATKQMVELEIGE